MSGLNDVQSTNPAGTETPTLGDDRIRALTDKIIEFAELEHALSGEHQFLVGPLASRPAYGHIGRFYLLTQTGLLPVLQYDTGISWYTLTSLNEVIALTVALAAHRVANPIDHPTASVTSAKIADGNIKKRHLDGGTDNTSIAALVDSGSADDLHIHAKYDSLVSSVASLGGGVVDRGDPASVDIAYSVGNFPNNITWYTMDLSGIVPAGVKAIILNLDFNTDSASAAYFKIRRYGNTNEINAFTMWNYDRTAQAICFPDVNRFLQIKGAIGTCQQFDLNITVCGWFMV